MALGVPQNATVTINQEKANLIDSLTKKLNIVQALVFSKMTISGKK
jgi:putative sterol carrier protein